MMPTTGDRWRSDRWQELCRLKKWKLIDRYRLMLGQPAYPSGGGPRTVEEIASAIVGLEWTDKIRAEHFAKAGEGHERCGVMNFEIIHERAEHHSPASGVPPLSAECGSTILHDAHPWYVSGMGECSGIPHDGEHHSASSVAPEVLCLEPEETPGGMARCSKLRGHYEAIHRDQRAGETWAEWRQILPGSRWQSDRNDLLIDQHAQGTHNAEVWPGIKHCPRCQEEANLNAEPTMGTGSDG